MKKYGRTLFAVTKAALLVAIGLAIGLYAGVRYTGTPFGRDTYDMQATMRLIKSRHVGESVTDDQLYYGAIKGMVESMKDDPFSHFMEPTKAKLMDEDMAGNFAGVGVEIGRKDGRPLVIAPIDGSPAAKAGIAAGDVITAVNGVNTYGLDTQDIISTIRGAKGTPVTLTVQRDGSDTARDVSLVRDTIVVKSVKSKIVTTDAGGRYLHVTVTGFHQDTGPLFRKAAKDALESGISGVILDLRNDPGGYISAAEAVSCSWIANQPYVLVEFKDGKRTESMCRGKPLLAGLPTVVLINKGSASASEITAGALQDLAFAHVIGEKSYGKGCGQDVVRFPDGAQLNLTAFLWFTPNGRSINKLGITPNETVVANPVDIAKGKDVQLDRAITHLSAPRR